MDDQRKRARATARAGLPDDAAGASGGRVRESSPRGGSRRSSPARDHRKATPGRGERENGPRARKACGVPFYPAGGGQVPTRARSSARMAMPRARAEVCVRLGDDQAVEVAVEEGDLEPGERVMARVDRRTSRDRGPTHRDAPAARRAAESGSAATCAGGGIVRRVRKSCASTSPTARARPGGALARRGCGQPPPPPPRVISQPSSVRALTPTLERRGASGPIGPLFGEKVRRTFVAWSRWGMGTSRASSAVGRVRLGPAR